MRINNIYTYLCNVIQMNTMKARLNLTIEEPLLKEVKKIAAKQHTSVSELVENYFISITKHKKKTFIEIIDALPKPNIPEDLDLIDEYYKAKMKKYGL